ncbi:MAG TPA: alanyl-tRNA editing protein [Candidatus Thermoplasmatota archaeon]|nr:alanyl-tRNA editing protein [Candidatus Thermoplasmatota archaeon]
MTRMLYMEGGLERCYDRSFKARVLEARPDHVILDQTLFYPLGGGQEWDTGVLRTGDGREARVAEVTKRGPVKHVLGAGHALLAGDEVAGTIDWDRRYAHMRMHTAQHLVSGLAYELFGGPRTVGNQIHAERSRIDFNPVNFTNEMLRDLEAAANDAVRAGYAVATTSMTRDEINAELPPERTSMDRLPASVTDLRVIRIGSDVDLCPCAGTHVQDTREIGELRILARTSKGSGTQRIEYALSPPTPSPPAAGST